jgi:hypothetical protein
MLELISTKDAAKILGVTKSAISLMVARGALRPAMRLPGGHGAFMFLKDDILLAAADHDQAGKRRPGPARVDVDDVA